MRNLMIASAAALAFAAVPAVGSAQMQSNMNQMNQPRATMTAEQQRMYDRLDADKRMVYDRMPMEQQQYYMTLNTQQQDAWFMLDDDQRMRLYNMEPTQRNAAWTSVMQQINAANTGMTGAMPQNNAAMSNHTAMNNSMARTNNMAMNNQTVGNIRYVSTTLVQPTPADAGPPTGDVPVCGRSDYDNCINAWEAGRRGPGVDRPADRYPGPLGPNPRR